MKRLILIIISITIWPSLFSQSWKSYPYEPAGSLVSFPVDEGRHGAEPVEWWYTSGHLTGETTGKEYSYMLTYFYAPQLIFDGFRILNFSDETTGLFSDETMALNYNILATDRLNIEADIFTGGIETWHNKTGGTGAPLPFEYLISAESSEATLSLQYDAFKPPLVLGGDGLLDLGTDDYSYYYSQTGIAVTGTISFNGITENVTGTGWMDRQYGNFNPSSGQEYEWFCIQLSNGMDFNVYNIFTADNRIPDMQSFRIFSAYVDEATQYTTFDFEIERLHYSYMPDSLRCYSQKWRITSPLDNVDILVETRYPNNEVSLPFRFYEGSTTVSGTVNGIDVTGSGFAELTHSYEKPDIIIGDGSSMWNITKPLTWQPASSDDGNPLSYDIEYSLDNRQTFLSLAQNVADTFYYWNDPPLTEGDSCWLKVTGFSIDTTLVNRSTKKLYATLTGVNNTEEEHLFIIYPNPSTGQFTVEGINIQNIDIADINGKIIYSAMNPLPVHHIDLANRPKGIYFVKVRAANATETKKIVLR